MSRDAVRNPPASAVGRFKFLPRLLLLAGLGCTCGVALATLPANILFSNYALTPSHRIDTRYQNGDDGSQAIPLKWGAIADISVPCNANFSVTLRSSYLTEAGSPNATLSLATGGLPTGWALNTNTLDLTATGSGSALISVRATRLGVTSDSNAFNLGCTAPVGTDVTAPTVPTGLAVVNGTGSVTASWDAASDPYYTAPGSGVASYDVCLNGAGCQNTVGTAGLAYQLTSTTLGSYSAAPTVTQQSTGTDWTIVNGGSLDGASDLLEFTGSPMTGDGFATVKVNSITPNGATFTKFGLQIRDSLNSNSRDFTCATSTLTTAQTRARLTDGGTSTNLNTISNLTLPLWFRLTRAGNNLTCEYSTDGNVFGAISSNYALSVSTTAYWGMVGTSTLGNGGAQSTGVFQQFNLQNIARPSYVYSTGSGGAITVRSNDVAGNHSAYGGGVTGTPAVASGTIKWHSGIYLWFPAGNSQASNLAVIDDAAANVPSVTGVAVLLDWKSIETGFGVYTTAAIAPYVAKVQAANNAGHRDLRLIIRIRMGSYGTPTGIFPGNLPSYLNNSAYDGGAVVCPSGGSCGGEAWAVKVWNHPTMLRLEALSAYLASQYDSSPYVEQLDMLGESAIAARNVSGSNYTDSAYTTEIENWMQTQRPVWAHTQLRWGPNFLASGDAALQAMIAFAVNNQITVGGPDTGMPPGSPSGVRDTQANRIWRGLNGDGTTHAGWPDFRDTGSWIAEVQEMDAQWCANAVCTLAGFQQTMHDTMHAHNEMWLQNTFQGTTPYLWPAEKTFFNGGGAPMYSINCPTTFTNGCNTN